MSYGYFTNSMARLLSRTRTGPWAETPRNAACVRLFSAYAVAFDGERAAAVRDERAVADAQCSLSHST